MSKGFKFLFERMVSGEMSDADIADTLVAREEKGINADELYAAASILRGKMIPVSAPAGAIDIVGTGGDGLFTYNISTACCFVVAGAGVPVAKHGNRAISSKSGASDVLRELGVKLDISILQTEICLNKAGVGFLFAPNHHKVMAHVAKARAMLGRRTIFNRLGPLCNPASVQYLLLGVYEDALRPLYAETLQQLGTKRALVVHGMDGMDEVTTTAPTWISEVNDGQITEYEITPEQFGLIRAKPSDLVGSDPANNAKALLTVLNGEPGSHTDIVLLNSATALYASGRANTILDGIEIARTSIISGGARDALEKLVIVSNA